MKDKLIGRKESIWIKMKEERMIDKIDREK